MAPLGSAMPSVAAKSGVRLLNLNAQPAARDMAVRQKLADDVLDGRSGNGEADADRPAGRREDHRVHADHLAAQIEGRSARIAAVDRRVDLDEVGIGLLVAAEIAPDGRHDARGHRIGKTVGIADRDHPVADAQLPVIAELDGRQRLVGLDLEQRDVGCRIRADQLGVEAAPVGQFDRDLLGVRRRRGCW